jgi:hypothetical protein
MSDSVLALVLIAPFLVVMTMVRFFKTADGAFWAWARAPIVTGFVAGLGIRFAERGSASDYFVIGLVLTVAALYVRRIGDETETMDGMILGAFTGGAAALPSVIDQGGALLQFAECVVAGAIAGLGITYATRFVNSAGRRLMTDAVTALAAVGASAATALAVHDGVPERLMAEAVAVIIPLIVIAAIFQQWSDVRGELSHEASLGFLESDQVRSTANPLLRLGRAGWSDPRAHREFVRVATKLALRKRQQRHRAHDVARLYQLEIIKLRMLLQQMVQIDRDVGRRRADPEEIHSSAAPNGSR